MARARSSTSQCAWPVTRVKPAGTTAMAMPASASGSLAVVMAFPSRRLPPGHGVLGVGARAAERMPAPPGARPPGLALAAPDERGRRPVPAAARGLQPGDDLLGRLGLLAVERPALEDPL